MLLINAVPGGPPEPAPQRSWGLARLAGIAAVPALIGAFIGFGGLDLVVPQDPYEDAIEEAGQRLQELPGFEARFGDLEDDEAFSEGVALGLAAIPHLSDAELDEWLTISRQMLGMLDVEACAMIARGPDSVDEVLEAMRAIDIDVLRGYINLLVSGARGELANDEPAPAATQAEADSALRQLVERLGVDRMGEIGAVLNDRAAPAESLCTALRDFYDAVADLDTDVRLILLRSILAIEAGPRT